MHEILPTEQRTGSYVHNLASNHIDKKSCG